MSDFREKMEALFQEGNIGARTLEAARQSTDLIATAHEELDSYMIEDLTGMSDEEIIDHVHQGKLLERQLIVSHEKAEEILAAEERLLMEELRALYPKWCPKWLFRFLERRMK